MEVFSQSDDDMIAIVLGISHILMRMGFMRYLPCQFVMVTVISARTVRIGNHSADQYQQKCKDA